MRATGTSPCSTPPARSSRPAPASPAPSARRASSTPARSSTVQGCLLSGKGGTVTVDLSFLQITGQPETSSLVEVSTPTRADKERLQGLDLDLTEHATPDSVTVVTYGEEDEQLLTEAGFSYDVEIADMAARSASDRRADAAFAAAVDRTELPSGRTEYRRLADYEAEMKALVAEHPGPGPRRSRSTSRPSRAGPSTASRSPPTSTASTTASPSSSTWARTTPGSGPRPSTPWSGPTSCSRATAPTPSSPTSSARPARSSCRSSTSTASPSRARPRRRTPSGPSATTTSGRTARSR